MRRLRRHAIRSITMLESSLTFFPTLAFGNAGLSSLAYASTTAPVVFRKEPAAPAAPAVPEKKRALAPYARFAVLATLGAAVILLAILAGERLPYFMMAAEWVGMVEFAFVGALAAGLAGCDPCGGVIVAGMTSLGGGTIRDVLLGNVPVFWMQDWAYVMTVLGVSLATFFLWPRLATRYQWGVDGELVFWMDTVGLASSVVAGVALAEANHERVTVFASAIAGTSTGCFGGIFRDVFLQKPVRILNSHLELYASPAFMGALATALILRLRPAQANAALAVGFFVVSCGRVLCGNQPVRRVFDDAAVLVRSSGEEPASPRHRAGVVSMAWRTTRRSSTNAP